MSQQNIYVIGPPGSGKTHFIDAISEPLYRDFIIESSEMKIHEDALMTYIVLPKPDVLAQRAPNLNINQVVGDWLDFYAANKDKVKLIENM